MRQSGKGGCEGGWRPPERRKFPMHMSGWKRRLIDVLIASIILLLIYYLPEKKARREASEFCSEIRIYSEMSLNNTLLQEQRARDKARFSTLYAVNSFISNESSSARSGTILYVFLGGFPFGREYCVVKVRDGVVAETRIIFDAYDYDYCAGDVRKLYECPG
jgi:hypothetical protein